MDGWLERAIAAISPATAVKREQARVRLKALAQAGKYYDGATRSRRGASIRRTLADQNTVARGALSRLREGARDLVRNNPYAARGVQVIQANVVGAGIIPHFADADGTRRDDIKALAKAHLDTTDCDADGLHTLYGLQGLACRTMAESGEVLVRRRRRRSTDGLAVPVQYQVLEPDFLDHTKDGPTSNGGMIIQGIEFDAIGRRRAYWLFDQHPGAGLTFRNPMSRAVPASEVAHLYRVDRPGQARGIPWLAPVMLPLADWSDYEGAQRMRQKIAACFSVFILGGDGIPTAQKEDGQFVEQLEPGIVQWLGAGDDVKFAEPPGVEGYAETANVTLHGIATGLGITYEALTGDLRGVNFSSGRMGKLEFHRNVDHWQWLTMVPRLCSRLTTWFLEAAALTGVDTDGVRVTHAPPRREMLDPPREVAAERDEIRAGLLTPSGAIRRRGGDPEAHFDEMAEDYDRIRERGLVLDSDAQLVSRAGLTQARPAGSEIPGGEDDVDDA